MVGTQTKQSKANHLISDAWVHLVHRGCRSHAHYAAWKARLRGSTRRYTHAIVIICTRDRPVRIGARPRTLAIGRRTDADLMQSLGADADGAGDGAGDGITSRRAPDSDGPGEPARESSRASRAQVPRWVPRWGARPRSVVVVLCNSAVRWHRASCGRQGGPIAARGASHPGCCIYCIVHQACIRP